MEYLPVVLSIALTVLTIILVVVGVYAVQVLQRLKYTLDRVNTTMDLVEEKVVTLTAPLHSLSGMAATVGSGMKIFESFTGWMNHSKKGK